MTENVIAVGIMAHNEEKVIGRVLSNLEEQQLPDGTVLRIVVVANACNDRTCRIVRELQTKMPNLDLIETELKGKSRALGLFKRRIESLNAPGGSRISKLLFMDADIQFESNDAIRRLSDLLDRNPALHAVLPSGHPRIDGSSDPFIAKLYEAKSGLANAARGSALSGQCYMIREAIAQQIEIPDYILGEDVFIAEKLRGGYLRDHGIRYFFHLPPDLSAEVRRIFRHSLVREQMHHFYRRRMFEKPLLEGTVAVDHDAYDRYRLLRKFLGIGIRNQSLILFFYMLGLVGDLRAKILLSRYGAENIKMTMEQWQTIR